MIVTEFSQQQHPELNLRVTQVSQDIILGNFQDWCKDFYLTNPKDNRRLSKRTLKRYYEQRLTPIQAYKCLLS